MGPLPIAEEHANQRWTALVEKVSDKLPEAMKSVMRVASDEVVEAYNRLVRNITFWPTFSSDTMQKM